MQLAKVSVGCQSLRSSRTQEALDSAPCSVSGILMKSSGSKFQAISSTWHGDVLQESFLKKITATPDDDPISMVLHATDWLLNETTICHCCADGTPTLLMDVGQVAVLMDAGQAAV